MHTDGFTKNTTQSVWTWGLPNVCLFHRVPSLTFSLPSVNRPYCICLFTFAQSAGKMNILQFRDLKVTPDIVQEYRGATRNISNALIIDNGSYGCRAGWANGDCDPKLIFRNHLAKPRRDRNKKEGLGPTPATQIGNDIVNIEALRFQLRTQFDRNVVTHFHVQEQILDYIFKNLAIDTAGQVNHPIVMTEVLLNPNYSRQRK